MTLPVPAVESLTVEFKSDRKLLSVDAIVLAVTCLANTDGGTLYLGVEDDGAITGLNPGRTDLAPLTAQIAERTHPNLIVRVAEHHTDGQRIAVLTVPRAAQPVANTKGTLVRRSLDSRGQPQCKPFYPDAFASHQSRLGQLDPSRGAWPGAELSDLDPVARIELRRIIEVNPRSDKALLDLSDAELDGALRLTESTPQGERVPTLTGMLLVGKTESLHRLVPNHEVAFQVLSGTDVRTNDFYRTPLVRLLPRIEESVALRNDESEIQVGLFRVAIPRVDPEGFREALMNAVSHRDYHRIGAVHVQWRDDELTVSSPGGLMAGVTVDRLLTADPTARNPNLADALKRIGLAERTGRGVDRIYRGLVRYGRPAPDWSDTNEAKVKLSFRTDGHDVELLRWVVSEERDNGPLPVETLLIMAALKERGPQNAAALSAVIQRNTEVTRRTLMQLVQRGLLTPRGEKRGRDYALTSRVFRDDPVAYVQHNNIPVERQLELILQLARASSAGIQRAEVVQLLGIEPRRATTLLNKLVEGGSLERIGERRGTRYVTPHNGHKL